MTKVWSGVDLAAPGTHDETHELRRNLEMSQDIGFVTTCDPVGWEIKCGPAYHKIREYDEQKAERMFERFEELGGWEFLVSEDFYHMLTEEALSAAARGYRLICKHSLPPNSVIKHTDETCSHTAHHA